MIYFVTHPEVIIDPAVPVPEWDLSAEGHRRLEKMLEQPWVQTLAAVFSSAERKSLSAAQRIAEWLGIQAVCLPDLGEVDRSATGYLERVEHSRVVAELFARPMESARGWERAIDAQRRIVRAVDRAAGMAPAGRAFAIESHGGVGTLLMNHLKRSAITRSDAPAGQGYYIVLDREVRELLQGWKAIDDLQDEGPRNLF